jgi:Fur family peroxide stress response transcriptional regulator
MKIPQKKKEQAFRFKRTPQRLAILEYLEGNTSHPSAENIFKAVSATYYSMSFATVYNTLNALTQAGMLRELTIDPARKRYDPDTSNHHHLICMQCGMIVDIPGTISVELPKSAAGDFIILGNHIEFYGRCSTCMRKRPMA